MKSKIEQDSIQYVFETKKYIYQVNNISENDNENDKYIKYKSTSF